jgi:hypothetical protein
VNNPAATARRGRPPKARVVESVQDVDGADTTSELTDAVAGGGELEPTSPPPCAHGVTYGRIHGAIVERVCEACKGVVGTVPLSRFNGAFGA